jgi:hypothetical protein
VLLGLLAFLSPTIVATSDDVYPIVIKPEHGSVAWIVTLGDREASCTAKAWIGRMREPPTATLFAVEFDDTVAPTVEGETPLDSVGPGTYDLHYGGGGCLWAYSLVPG